MYLSDLSNGALKTPATLHINDSIAWRELREWRK
jgi:hypothetical protein